MDEEKGIYYTDKKIKNIKLNSFLNGAVIVSFVYLIILLLVIYSLHLVINRFGEIGKDENVTKLMTVLQLYDEVYVGDIEIDKMVDGAISTITEVSGDKYGHYIPSYNADTSGQMYSTGSYVGIGFSYLEYFNLENPYIEVVSIVEDSPAGRSSMKIGDKITHINGEIISEEVITNFKKSRKEDIVKSYIFRLNGIEDIEIMIGEVKEPILDFEIIDNVGFIHIYDFVPETSVKFKEAIDNIVADNVKNVIFDLRNNGGGQLDVVVEMLDYLIEKETIVNIKYETGKEEKIGSVDGRDVSNLFDCVILSNKNTASASELFILILKETMNTTLVGTKTFGKGTVGTSYTFNDGSILNISTGLYYTEKGKNIEEDGIVPDIELNKEDIIKEAKELYKENKLVKK